MGWWVYLYKELDLSIKGKVEFYALWSSFAPRFVFHIISLSLVSCNGCKRIDLRQHMCKTWNDTASPQCWFGLHPIHLHKELIFIMFGISQQYWFRLRDVCLGLFRGQFKAHHSFPDFQSSILRLTNNEKYFLFRDTFSGVIDIEYQPWRGKGAYLPFLKPTKQIARELAPSIKLE